MSNFINIILSNEIFTIIALCLIGVIIFLVIKKLIKLLVYAAIILIAFLSYVFYSGKTIDSAMKPVEKAIDKAEQVVK
jgi:multisubunit Na+/H+ antiporter MnhC subunit